MLKVEFCADFIASTAAIFVGRRRPRKRIGGGGSVWSMQFSNDINLILTDLPAPGVIIDHNDESVRLNGNYFQYEFKFSVPEGHFQLMDLANYFR